jgi:hypothetical protein
MQTSETNTEIYKALQLLSVKVPKVIKTRQNDFLKSKYADLSDVKDAIFGALDECGLFVIQSPTGNYSMHTKIIHLESGEFVEDTFQILPKENNPQLAGSIITYQRRYALVTMLGLVADDDDDANEVSKPLDSKSDEKKINDCKTLEELKKVWEDNPEWHTNQLYCKKVAFKKSKLT